MAMGIDQTFDRHLRALVRSLSRPKIEGLFNPYRDHDPALDRAAAASHRRRNLRLYLRAFRSARHALVGEAAGYNGCRFSGLPFTGEDLLVGEKALPWTEGLSLKRSSRGSRPTSERSANIVWGAIGDRRDHVLWNAVPWHPHRPGQALTNRKPRRDEIESGLLLLREFFHLFPKAIPVAVGRVAESSLRSIGLEPIYLRHPSMGGQPRFLAGMRKL